ncbi:structural maintenance of chromosomes protein 5 [Tanacetum coccineum]
MVAMVWSRGRHMEVLDCHQKAVEKNRETLSHQKALNAEQERDVERVRQRDELLSKAESMKKKLPWLKYDMKKSEYLKVKDQEKEAKQQMEEAAKTLNDIREPIDKQKKEKKDHDIKCNKLRDLLDNIDTSRKQMLDKDNQLGAKVKGKYKDMEELEKQEQSRQARISKAEKDLADAELELQNLPRYEPPKEKIEKLTAEILDLEQSAKELKISCRAYTINDAYCTSQRHELLRRCNGSWAIEAFITQDSAERDYLVKNLKSFDVAVINHLANVHRTRADSIAHTRLIPILRRCGCVAISTVLTISFNCRLMVSVATTDPNLARPEPYSPQASEYIQIGGCLWLASPDGGIWQHENDVADRILLDSQNSHMCFASNKQDLMKLAPFNDVGLFNASFSEWWCLHFEIVISKRSLSKKKYHGDEAKAEGLQMSIVVQTSHERELGSIGNEDNNDRDAIQIDKESQEKEQGLNTLEKDEVADSGKI